MSFLCPLPFQSNSITASSRRCRHRLRRRCQILRQILNARLRTEARPVRLRGHIDAILRTAGDVEMVVDLLQLATLAAADGGIDAAAEPAQRLLDLLGRVGLGGGGHDARHGEELVAVQALEELDRFPEVVDHFLLRGVVDVAFRVEGRDAGAVLAPFVLPEGFIIAGVVLPVFLHVFEQAVGVVRLQDLRYVLVLAGFVAVLVVGTVAVVGPEEDGALSLAMVMYCIT